MAHTPPYQSDTLRWIAAEVRYPRVDEFEGGVPAAFHDHIRDEFPIPEDVTETTVMISPAGPSAQQTIRRRFATRDRLMSLTVARDSIVIEATVYDGWTKFRDVFMRALNGLADVRRPDGIVRVGLRYIDEVRVPEDLEGVSGWRGWVDERLLAPALLADDGPPTNVTVVLQYGEQRGYVTLFRAAPFESGRTVQPDGPLRMPFETPDGPYFLLDTDASWTDPDGLVPEFELERLGEVLDRLHEPCIRLFEAAVGPRLRDEVLTRPREEVWNS